MNVLVITSLFPNNQQPDFGNFVFRRMAAFSGLEGNQVKVLAPIPYCPSWLQNKRWAMYHSIMKREMRGKIEVFHPRYPHLPMIAMPFHAVLMAIGILSIAYRLHKKYRFDLIDSHFIYPDGLAAIWVGKALNVPVVLSARGSDIHQFLRFRTIRPQIVHALRHAGGIISVCNALKDEMSGVGIDPKKIDVIPNGIDTARFAYMERLKAREKLGIPIQDKVILAVGGLVAVKRHDRIINALPNVIGRYADARLYIIGEGPERATLSATIERLGLGNRVQLVGHRPNTELKFWYNAADVFCLSSSREGWANVIMEAMACGTPVVATNVYGAPEIITNDRVGILVEQRVESIADGLIQALGKSWNREEIRAHVAGRSWEVVAREVKTTFHKVIG